MKNRKLGLSLVELLIVTAIMGILAVAAAGLMSASLQAYEEGRARFDRQREGLLAMERMTDAVRRSTFLFIPNAHDTQRDILALSGLTNADGFYPEDFYFGDTLFPRIDEDISWDMDGDGANGIAGLDEDGDGQSDERTVEFGGADDDEDGLAEEDPLNGLDDDGDGNVDEDCGADSNGDGAPGLAGVDDDGDGLIDEGDFRDDDEDGLVDEGGVHPVVYRFDQAAETLSEWSAVTGKTILLSEHVRSFTVKYQNSQLVTITLVLFHEQDEITFRENAFRRNALQRTGKRVR